MGLVGRRARPFVERLESGSLILEGGCIRVLIVDCLQKTCCDARSVSLQITLVSWMAMESTRRRDV